MRVLLTGTSGFLGKEVAQLLEKQGAELYHLTRRSLDLVNEIVWDFTSPLPPLPRVDAFIHMAATVDFSDVTSKPLLDNAVPILHLAHWLAQNNIRLYYTSAASIHGQATHWGLSAPLSPSSPYIVSKLIGERIFTSVRPQATIFRLGGIYGIHGPRHLGLNRAIDDAIFSGIPPVLYGSGRALRNYICVKDAASWISAEVINPTCQHNQANILYLGGNEILSIRKYLQTIIDVFLPGEVIQEYTGCESQDIIIDSSKSPIIGQTFKEYLKGIKDNKA